MKRIHEVKIDDAEYYEKIWGEEFNTRPYYDAVRQRALARHVTTGSRLLDVGAGVFGTAQYVAEHTRARGVHLTAVDQSHTAQQIVQQVCPEIDYVLAEFENGLPFDSGSFDCVTAGEIIEHMEDPEKFAHELLRVCVTDGWVTMSTVNPNCQNAQKHGEYPEHLWEFHPHELVAMFDPGALYKRVGDYHFVERKK